MLTPELPSRLGAASKLPAILSANGAFAPYTPAR
jgi:hypothetical protein